MKEQQAKVIAMHLFQRIAEDSGSGPQWAHESEDLDMTLLSWPPGKSVAEHINNEVDVLLIGLVGNGIVTVEKQEHPLNAGVLLLIPKGKQRSMQSGDEQWSYLSIHRRRRGLVPTVKGKPIV